MIRLFLIPLIGWSGLAAAQMDVNAAKAMQHNFSVLGSMSRGGFAFGAAYEYMYDSATGVSAIFRNFPKSGEAANNYHTTNGYMILGAGLGHHFFKGKWDLAFTPSFNLISIDSYYDGSPASAKEPDDTTTMGPGLSISLLWTLTERIAVGFDYSNYWVWFEEDFRGNVISDMAVKLKFAF